MKKVFNLLLVVIVAAVAVLVPLSNETILFATNDKTDVYQRSQAINYTFQFLNPYDGLTSTGVVPSEMSINAGNNIMNNIMGPKVSVENIDNEWFVTLMLATQLDMGGFTLQNLEIFVEDAAGSNTYTSVPYTVGESVSVDDQEYEFIHFNVDALDLIINPRYNMMSNSGFFIILDTVEVEAVVNKSALSSKLAEARAISSEGVKADSYAQLQIAIVEAQRVYDDVDATTLEVNEQVRLLTNAMNALVTVSKGLQNGIYEVPIALWHATENRPSMVAASLNDTARIVVKDGVETMYVYTQAGTVGYIPGFQILTPTHTYVNAEVMTRNAEGMETSFSFLLENHNPFLSVRVLTSLDNNQGMDARFKIDYSQLKEIDSETI